ERIMARGRPPRGRNAPSGGLKGAVGREDRSGGGGPALRVTPAVVVLRDHVLRGVRPSAVAATGELGPDGGAPARLPRSGLLRGRAGPAALGGTGRCRDGGGRAVRGAGGTLGDGDLA